MHNFGYYCVSAFVNTVKYLIKKLVKIKLDTTRRIKQLEKLQHPGARNPGVTATKTTEGTPVTSTTLQTYACVFYLCIP